MISADREASSETARLPRLWRRDVSPAIWLGPAIVGATVILVAVRGLVPVGQATLNGFVAAGYLALGAVGLTLIFGTLRIINFAHGDFLTLGTYLTFGIAAPGIPFWPAAALAILATALIALAIDRTVWEPMRRARTSTLQLFLVAIGLALVIRFRYGFQNAAFAGDDGEWRALQSWASERLGAIGLGDIVQLPLLIAVWVAFVLCLFGLKALQETPWGRVLKAIREDEDAASALGKNVFAFKLQSLGLAAALAAIAGAFLALNVTYLYPSEFDPGFTFFGYAVLILGGFASYSGVVLGTSMLWVLIEGLRFLDLPLSSGQVGSLRFVIVGLILILLSMLRRQGLLGLKAEMQLRS
jgi:branched-chain amino acid transport system permease protein